jgi:hypothetical protein
VRGARGEGSTGDGGGVGREELPAGAGGRGPSQRHLVVAGWRDGGARLGWDGSTTRWRQLGPARGLRWREGERGGALRGGTRGERIGRRGRADRSEGCGCRTADVLRPVRIQEIEKVQNFYSFVLFFLLLDSNT